MTRDQVLRESDFCRKSAEAVSDPSHRLALIELADWWAWQADLAKPPMTGGRLFQVSDVGSRERASTAPDGKDGSR